MDEVQQVGRRGQQAKSKRPWTCPHYRDPISCGRDSHCMDTVFWGGIHTAWTTLLAVGRILASRRERGNRYNK